MTIFTFGEQVHDVADAEDLTLSEIERWVRMAARCTHPIGNRRYHDWVFDVEERGKDTHVERMCKYELTDYASGAQFELEECEDCDGAGCRDCGYAGVVKHLK